MDFPTEKIPLLLAIVGVAIWACLGVWAWVFFRKQAGLPVLPVAWRRPVPWRGIDLLLFLGVYFFVIVGMTMFASPKTPSDDGYRPVKEVEVVETVLDTGNELEVEKHEIDEPEASKKSPPKERGHELTLLLRSGDPWIIGFCFFVAVIFAPINEEIVFRMFIQGYLEKLDGRLRRQARRIRAWNASQGVVGSKRPWFTILPWGVAPLLITSAFFAMLHFRMAKESPPLENLFSNMVVFVFAGTISLILLLFWLRTVRGAQLSDFGIVPREIPRDIFRGLIAFFAIAAPIYAIQIAAASLVPEEFAPDPISIFFLSVAFGTVWCRTHRLVPSIVMHMSLNASSLLLAMYFMG